MFVARGFPFFVCCRGYNVKCPFSCRGRYLVRRPFWLKSSGAVLSRLVHRYAWHGGPGGHLTRSEQQGIKDEENQVPFWRVGDLKCAKGPVSDKANFSETDPGGTHFLVAAGDSKVGS